VRQYHQPRAEVPVGVWKRQGELLLITGGQEAVHRKLHNKPSELTWLLPEC